MCYKQKCKVVSLNLAHPVERTKDYALAVTSVHLIVKGWQPISFNLPSGAVFLSDKHALCRPRNDYTV